MRRRLRRRGWLPAWCAEGRHRPGRRRAAFSNQNAVNSNTPVSIAGGNVSSGPSSAARGRRRTHQPTSRTRPRPTRTSTSARTSAGARAWPAAAAPAASSSGRRSRRPTSGQPALRSATRTQSTATPRPRPPAGTSPPARARRPRPPRPSAYTDVSNKAKTDQDQGLKQDIGGKDCGCSKDGKDGHDGLSAGSGGAGGFQAGVQAAETNQWALGIAKSDQNAVNANAPASTAGGNIASGPSSANQTATSSANTDVSNKAKTDQDQGLKQDIGGKDCGCSKDGHDGLSAGSGGAGGAQPGVQLAETDQWAAGVAYSDQNAVNSNTPSSTAGGNIYAGPSLGNSDGGVDRHHRRLQPREDRSRPVAAPAAARVAHLSDRREGRGTAAALYPSLRPVVAIAGLALALAGIASTVVP